MILPNNGKVVVIDDQLEDVKELICSLSKEKMPFVHYKEEDLSDLPDTPIENVRLVFLDLELVAPTYLGSDSKNITAPIKSRLKRILAPKTSYALIIWSRKENKYKTDLLKDFNTDFKDYCPIFCTSLPKADIIGKSDAIASIKEELKVEIEKFKAFNAFLIWEAIVNDAAGKLTNSITTIYPPDANWDAQTKFLLYKLALAYSGKAVHNFDSVRQLKNAFYTLTLSLSDNIDSSIDLLIDDQYKDLVSSSGKASNNFSSAINKLLLISSGSDEITQPGNIYFTLEPILDSIKENEEEHVRSEEKIKIIPTDKQQQALVGIQKAYNVRKGELNQKKAEITRMQNDIVVSSLIEDVYKKSELRQTIIADSIFIELNITPLCDYAQEKAKNYRLLPGVLIKSKHRGCTILSAYSYISDADFNLFDADYFFLFDFRFLHSEERDAVMSRLIKFRIKQQLLSDIQSKLGSHIIRAGVNFLS